MMDIDDIVQRHLAAAIAEADDELWREKIEGDGTGEPKGFTIDAKKLSAYMVVSDELIHPESYPRPEPVKISRRLRFRWWRTRTRETVGYWIAGHDPEDDDW